MGAWKDLRDKQQAEVNAFPIHFAFGNEQIQRKIQELNLDQENWSSQVVGIGAGGFVLKDDLPALKDMFKRHREEREALIATDTTGDGVIYEMFYAALVNTEYGYTVDWTDALEHEGYTEADIEADPRLKNGLKKAAADIRKKEGFEW